MNARRRHRLVVATIFFTVSLMAFAPHGTFNPTKIGFWTSIFAGLLWGIFMYILFKKYSVNEE